MFLASFFRAFDSLLDVRLIPVNRMHVCAFSFILYSFLEAFLVLFVRLVQENAQSLRTNMTPILAVLLVRITHW